MKVKLTESMVYNGSVWPRDSVVDVEIEKARMLVESGQALEVDTLPPRKKVNAEPLPAPEKAEKGGKA